MPTSTENLRNPELPSRFGVAPFHVSDSDPDFSLIADSLRTLVSRQRRDGSWGRHSALDRLITTCHATMALQAGGYSLSDSSLEKARRWLCSPKAAKHNNSYWILSPLAAWYDKSIEVKKCTDRELLKLIAAIDNGAQPHPDQYVHCYYLRLVESVPRLADAQVTKRYTSFIRERWSVDQGWARRADTTTGCYAVLTSFDPDFAASIRDRVIQLISSWADHPEPGFTCWRSPISTAYTVMNIVESGLIEVPEMQAEASSAVTWMKSQTTSTGLWRSEMPYGGEGDIKSLDYPTGVVLRAVLAYLSSQTRHLHAAIGTIRLSRLNNRINAVRRWAIFWATLALAFIWTDILKPLVGDLSIPHVDTVLGVIGLLIAGLAWLFPDAGVKAIQWIRRWFT